MTEETTRQLATVRRIDEIREHTNADSLELAIIGGWQVIVKKGEFAEGDFCVYFEIDSVLPILPEFEFLRKGCYVKKDWLATEQNPSGEGFRLKTIRLRKELSQGLVVPLTTDLTIQMMNNPDIEGDSIPLDGQDVTNLLGVVKWDPPLHSSLQGKARGNFPSFIPKTNQERIQNLKKQVLGEWSDRIFEVTMKMDGSSTTVYNKSGYVGICSRNFDLDINDDNAENSFIRAAIDSGLVSALEAYGAQVAVQGELMGPGVQGNRENFKELRIYMFDVWMIDEHRYMNAGERAVFYMHLIDHGANQYRFLTAPMVGFYYPSFIGGMEELLNFAKGPSLVHNIREGVVWKCIEDPSISFKIINNDFLENGGE